MKLRVQFSFDMDVPDEKAMEKYRSVDPQTVAQRVQADALSEFGEDAPDYVSNLSAIVLPIYGV